MAAGEYHPAITITREFPGSDTYRKLVDKAVRAFSADECKQLDEWRTEIKIDPDLDQGWAVHNRKKRTAFVLLPTEEPASNYLSALFDGFETRVIHELYHVIIGDCDFKSTVREGLQAARAAHNAAQAVAPTTVEKMDMVLRHSDPLALSTVPFDVTRLNDEQLLAFCIGTVSNPNFYAQRGYSPADYLEEMACEMRCLCHKYGEDKVRKFAGEFLDYVNTSLARGAASQKTLRS